MSDRFAPAYPSVMTEEIRASKIELVDSRDVVRMTLIAEEAHSTSEQDSGRIAPFSGVLVRDPEGNERGGFGFLAGEHGRVVFALDHPSFDAVLVMVEPDGSVTFGMNSSEPATRAAVTVGPDGTPSFSLFDRQERPRLRLTVLDNGAGAIEFLAADGSVVHTLAPERNAGCGH
jgi:hypothetical protein